MRLFRDGGRFRIPGERLHIVRMGKSVGIYVNGRWRPRHCALYIDMVNGGHIMCEYVGDYEVWKEGQHKWVLRKFYIGVVSLPDRSGPYEMVSTYQGKFFEYLDKMLTIDAERPLEFEDIRDVIRPGYEHFWPKGMGPGVDMEPDTDADMINPIELMDGMADDDDVDWKVIQVDPAPKEDRT